MTTKRRLYVVLVGLFLAGCSKWAYRVPTAAMEPTIKEGETVWTDLHYYHDHPVVRFDIIVFRAPQNGDPGGKDTKFVKRVIGLPNESVELRKGKVFVDGKEVDEKFPLFRSTDDYGPITIPQQEYFVLGDNRNDSYDSRYWTPPTITEAEIVGKVTEIKHE